MHKAAIAFLLGSAWAADIAPAPPVAKRVEHTEARHGSTVVDNYFWLREKSNPDVIEYLKAENAYTEAMTANLKPFQDALYQEMLGRIKQTDLSVPYRQGDYLYYSRTEEGKQYPIQCRKKGGMDAPEEVLLDLNQMAEGHQFISLGSVSVSDDQNLLAYSTDYKGFRQYDLHVKDLRTGQTLPDTTERVDNIAWAADNKTLFVTTEDAVTKRADHLWRHTLGKPEFEPVYEEKDELYRLGLEKTRDKRFVLLDIGSTDTTEVRYLRADQPASNFTVFLAREKKHRYDIDHRDNLFYIRTNKNAKNFQIVTAPENDPSPKNWKVFVAHDDNVLIEGVDLFRDFAVSIEKSEALNRIRIYDFKSGKWNSIAFPEPVYSVFPGGTPDYNSKTFRYSYQSLITPSSVYDYDAQTGKSTLLKRQEVLGGYDPSQYVSERQWATARDGVKVPVVDRLQKGLQARRAFAADAVRLRFVRIRNAGDLFERPVESAGSRCSLRDRPHPRRRRDGREMARRRHVDAQEEYLLRFHRQRRIPDPREVDVERSIADRRRQRRRFADGRSGEHASRFVPRRACRSAVRRRHEYDDGCVLAADRRRVSGMG